ncbi:MAG: DUF58 domain-containing protein [Planctomycetes bacterium]|nr:DUF58 domain-containing protein [Planctomycetota bacterium]MCB9916785.1 DUF58 domain-containing protein [Planctomycetota bacterium]
MAPSGDRKERPAVDPELLREVRRIQIRTDRLVTDVVSGGYSSVFRGSGIEFDEVREWVEGDDYRSVDWNVTARAGRPFIKKFVEERELTVLFVLDRSRSMRFGSVVRDGRPRSMSWAATEFVACLALSANRNNDKVGFVATDGDRPLFVPAAKGRAHVLRILRDCLADPADPSTDRLAEAIGYAARVQRKRAIVFVLSDFLGAFPERELRLLSRRHDLSLVPCSDPRLEELPKGAGLLHLQDLESGASQVIDAGSTRVRAAYAERARERREQLAERARRLGAGLLPIDTKEPVSSRVVAFFRKRELQRRHG